MSCIPWRKKFRKSSFCEDSPDAAMKSEEDNNSLAKQIGKLGAPSGLGEADDGAFNQLSSAQAFFPSCLHPMARQELLLTQPQCTETARREAMEVHPSDERFAEDVLQSHNAYRRRHGVNALRLSKSLCDMAQEWATRLARENRIRHRPDVELGQNLYWIPNPKISGSDPVDFWYSEASSFVFGGEPLGVTSSAHFSQVVWRDSRELGVGRARSTEGITVVVAFYDPAGNIMGDFAQNVLPPRG